MPKDATPDGAFRLIDDPAFPEVIRPGALATLNALEQLRQEPTIEVAMIDELARPARLRQ